MGDIHIFSHEAEHTTARYFERAASINGKSFVCYWDHCPELNELKDDDIVLYVDPAPDWPLGLESVPCLTVAYFIDVHREIHSRLQLSSFFDAIFIAQKEYVSEFRKIGHEHVYWLPLACDPEIHYAPVSKTIFEVGFVGKLGQPNSSRNKILTTVLSHYLTNDYRKFYKPRDMARIYAQSKIVLNASINGDLNMRFFEAMAAGSMLVTDRINNGLAELFEEGVHYIGYSTIEEAIEKIDYYLTNDDERKRIAEDGQQAVFNRHTYYQRWIQILHLSANAYGNAPARTYSPRKLGELYSDIFVSLRLPWRIMVVMCRYGMGKTVVSNLVKSMGRWLNARIPLTPKAIRIWLSS